MILDNAGRKVAYFNKIGVHYDAVYNYLIRNRNRTDAIISPHIINDITAGLISFDMQRMMGKQKYLIYGKNSWASRLVRVLIKYEELLSSFAKFKLQEFDLSDNQLRRRIVQIFDALTNAEASGLNISSSSKRFHVGASKILHFLIPDLFIIVDSNARSGLAKHHKFPKSKKMDGELYVKATKHYQDELLVWAEKNDDPDFSKLLKLDPSWKQYYGERPTPLPRIIDKCTFIGDKIFDRNQHLPLTFKAFIGGHFGTSYKVELYGEDITYSVFDHGDHLKTSKWINPSTKRWKILIDEIDEIGIWDWDSEYVNPEVTDGTTWSMNIQYADQSIDTRGENQFPGLNGSSVSYETDQFKKFLEAIRALIGGLPFH